MLAHLDKLKSKKKHDLEDEEITLVKFRIYMLTALDNKGLNVLHIACRNGSHLIHFLMEKADEYGVRHLIVNDVGD